MRKPCRCSDEFSEAKLKEARMANRLLQEGSDARLEEMYGDSSRDAEQALPDSIGQVNAWDDGAAEVADMIGAEVCCVNRWVASASCLRIWGRITLATHAGANSAACLVHHLSMRCETFFLPSRHVEHSCSD